jgi:septum formation protein
VVVHEGIIREKPTTKEEARQFLKGYSGSHVATVGSVVVTNLTTGKRLESLDKAEVIYFCSYSTYLIEAVCVQVRFGNAGDPIDMCDQRLLINIFDRI